MLTFVTCKLCVKVRKIRSNPVIFFKLVIQTIYRHHTISGHRTIFRYQTISRLRTISRHWTISRHRTNSRHQKISRQRFIDLSRKLKSPVEICSDKF